MFCYFATIYKSQISYVRWSHDSEYSNASLFATRNRVDDARVVHESKRIPWTPIAIALPRLLVAASPPGASQMMLDYAFDDEDLPQRSPRLWSSRSRRPSSITPQNARYGSAEWPMAITCLRIPLSARFRRRTSDRMRVAYRLVAHAVPHEPLILTPTRCIVDPLPRSQVSVDGWRCWQTADDGVRPQVAIAAIRTSARRKLPYVYVVSRRRFAVNYTASSGWTSSGLTAQSSVGVLTSLWRKHPWNIRANGGLRVLQTRVGRHHLPAAAGRVPSVSVALRRTEWRCGCVLNTNH